ncbi:class I SAM-dependent methyltransferase [Actinoplanes friuliensis]|uniref:S-adenosyl-L-methionine (SAM)-dependent methyltransferase n=1 Tax=Actinoplanes friuliensis DSM 7358 TaxID=1246995 RepID=U5W6U3_9ACTN|nr:class I SAM-dependent methyltransferase [Actinoplanes friuliensis]AGZ43641.1 S-adenosyl-L-methionine (SAM)-dependent methyltransferase [Actinoplanes friuliensis DSM 7358]
MATTTALRARNADFWARAAPGWIAHADHHDDWSRPLGAPALDRLSIGPRERVLDAGCGCGGTTADLARAVGAAGYAVGVDLSEEMVAAARRRHPGVEFVAGDLETMKVVRGAPFDAAYSCMALMLPADPVAVLTTVMNSLHPGGRLAATVFREQSTVPWLPAAVLGAAAHVGALPPLPVGDEPGPFALADPARTRKALTAAGFDTIAIEPRDVVLETPDDPDAVTSWLIGIGPAGAAYREAPPEAQAAARSGAARLLSRFRTPGVGYRLPTGIWLITAECA